MRKIWLGLILLGLVLLFASGGVSADADQVDVLEVKGAITPVLASYVDRGIDQAEAHGAVACIIEMDTPGGLDTSMRSIVQRILEADLPVVVYVPPGGRAASAGAFITLAAHVAAMAPATEIGAAHPVAIGEDGMDETMAEKVVNDAVAYIRSIAETRGRNADWAEAAVRESRSSAAQEALDLAVIDFIASSMDDLLTQLDGREVTLLSGEVVTIDTGAASVNYVRMGAIERFLLAITDPNIAYILMSVGMLGVLLELFNPGTIFPGVVGAICLMLSFYGLGMLSVNYVGVILILLAFALFVAELFTATNGILTLGGIASLTVGSLILMSNPLFRINPGLIAGVVIAVTAFFVFVIASVLRTHRARQQTGRDAMVGSVAEARTPLDPKGMVYTHGELWEATVDEGRVEPGEEVVIAEVDGLKLKVTKRKS
ncbi:MAG: nodulation protein NfeD [Chloroflexota bacterium]|nr:nodulation protein NfeD [Chloroflexota bacterium]